MPPTVTKQVASYAKLAQYQAARLGFATYAANHCEKVVVTDGGDTRTVVVRDTTAERPWKRVKVAAGAACTPAACTPLDKGQATAAVWAAATLALAPATAARPSATSSLPPPSCQSRRAAVARQVRANREAADEVQVANWLSRLELQPAATTTNAQMRIEAVCRRARSKKWLS